MFDYIVIGGGLVGGVLVYCLLIDLNNKVCLLEVGGVGNNKLVLMLVVFVVFI